MQLNPNDPICGPPVGGRADRYRTIPAATAIAIAFFCSLLLPTATAQWVEFQDETAARVQVDANLFVSDPQEKDYAWGDVDMDGDDDLIVVRKEGWVTSGGAPNLLLINEGGVLVDRTEEFASASDVEGDQGFKTSTNDRDVLLVDLDLDGWLDVVTAPTISPGVSKHIGHPRIYRNLGCGGACNGTEDWLGFRHEDFRIPTMLSDSGQGGFNPCFCAVAAGDVTGDGYPELWFIDYDSGCGQPGQDYNDKLLVNRGAAQPGVFDDITEVAFNGTINGDPFQHSLFGASGAVVDLNGDDTPDLVKQYASFVGVGFNEELDPGLFDTFSVPYTGSAYFVTTADLNQDDQLDLVVSDDGADRYLLNQGNGGDDIADFLSFAFSFQHGGTGGAAGDDGFSGNSVVADLDRDSWPDVLITDVDVESPGCTARRTHIYRNLGGTPGDFTVHLRRDVGHEVASDNISVSVKPRPATGDMRLGVTLMDGLQIFKLRVIPASSDDSRVVGRSDVVVFGRPHS